MPHFETLMRTPREWNGFTLQELSAAVSVVRDINDFYRAAMRTQR